MDERRKDRSLPLRPSNAFYELLIEADGGEAGRCPCDRGWQEADRDLTDRVQRQRVSVHDHVQLSCHICQTCTDANPQNSYADDKYFGMFVADKPHLDATAHKIPELHRLKPSSQAEPKRAGPLDLHRAYTHRCARGPSVDRRRSLTRRWRSTDPVARRQLCSPKAPALPTLTDGLVPGRTRYRILRVPASRSEEHPYLLVREADSAKIRP